MHLFTQTGSSVLGPQTIKKCDWIKYLSQISNDTGEYASWQKLGRILDGFTLSVLFQAVDCTVCPKEQDNSLLEICV